MSEIAYLTDIFPGLSTTFIQREVRAVERAGVRLWLTSWQPLYWSQVHPQDMDLAKRTFAIRPFSGKRLAEGWRALSMWPEGRKRAMRLVVRLGGGFPEQTLRNCTYLTGASVLACHLRQRRIEHVHVHFAFGSAAVAVFLKALTSIPYSLSIHGSDVLLPQPLLREKLEEASFVVSNCQHHVHYLKRKWPSLERQHFHVIRLGLDFKSSCWSRFDPPRMDSPLRILNIARLHPVKAHEILIEACGLLARSGVDFSCRIVGEGPRREELENLVRRMNLQERVKLLGPMFESDVIRELDSAQVFVLSSLSEGTPMTVIEAMARGRAVVAPRITALPEMVEDGMSGMLFEPGSSADLAQKLTRLSGRPQLIAELGIRGQARCRELFDLEANGMSLVRLFGRSSTSSE